MPLPSAPDTGWTFPFILFGCTVASAVLAVVVVYAATGRCESGFFGVTECGLEAVGTRLILAGIPLFSALTAVIVIAGFIGILPRRRMLALRAQQAILVAALGVVALWFAVNIAGG